MKKKRIEISLTDQEAKKAEQKAKEQNRTRKNWLEQVIIKAIK